MGTFPARVVCPAGGVCPWGSRTLVKIFTAWQVLASLAGDGSGIGGGGVGGSSFPRISAVSVDSRTTTLF